MPSETIRCINFSSCGNEFEFSERDQEFYADKGYAKPKRCRECREAKKQKMAQEENR